MTACSRNLFRSEVPIRNFLAWSASMIASIIPLTPLPVRAQVKTILAQGSLRRYFEKSAANRLSIPKDTKGFLKPHYDISVSVEDRPGMIAQIANACAEKNINIKDIEVLKIRENEGGTIRLAFSTEEERFLALSTLQKRGLECRKRE